MTQKSLFVAVVAGVVIAAAIATTAMLCIMQDETPLPQAAPTMIFGPQIAQPIPARSQQDDGLPDRPFYYFNGEKYFLTPLSA
jgi:hypothetical protein